MSLIKGNDNNKKLTLYEEWTENKTKAIKLIAEATSSPPKYIAFKTNYTDNDLKKVIIAICDQIKKEKEEKLLDPTTYNQAKDITRYFADLIKQRQIAQMATTSGKNKNDENDAKKVEEEQNKRKRQEEDQNLRINLEALEEIVDEANVNPTKRKKIISKTYLKDESEIPQGWYKIQQNKARPIVIIKPTSENIDTNNLKQQIEDILDEEKREYGDIEQITRNNKVITIHFDDIQNRDKFIKYAKEYRTEWNCEIPTLRNPCIRIGGVTIRKSNETDEINWDAWIEKIKNKNKWLPQTKESIFKINFKTQKNGKWNIVLEVSPNIRQAIIKKQGKIYTGLQKHDVYDNFNILTCYNCSTYGHTTNQCGQQPVCNFCSKQHYTSCPIQSDKNKHKCPACQKMGHSFNDPNCAEFIWRLNHELQFINMNYDIIMTPRK